MIVFCWEQLPTYAARCIRAFVEKTDEKVVVLTVPTDRFRIKGAEEMAGCAVISIGSDDRRSLSELAGGVPDVILAGGWSSPCFMRWVKTVKKAGGKAILCTDEAFTDKSLRQRMRKLRFRLFIDRVFDKIFICGKGGVKQFGEWYGIDAGRLITGLYGSDPLLFPDGPRLKDRPKRFLFIGHFDQNKNLLSMCAAFHRLHGRHPDWELEICGSGELEKDIPAHSGITLTGFVQSDGLGEKYRGARCLVLGSFKEQWGVVVHEAASSGCMLALSRAVGSRYDLARPENAVLFDPSSPEEIEAAMEKIIGMTDGQLDAAQACSVELAGNFSPQVFSENLLRAVRDLGIAV